MSNPKLIPSFVAHQPMSLRILSGLYLVMIQEALVNHSEKWFLCFLASAYILRSCRRVMLINGNLTKCSKEKAVIEAFTRICDGGDFTRQDGIMDYLDLFHLYDVEHIKNRQRG